MDTIGVQEYFFLLIPFGYRLVLVVAGIWALITLHKIRVSQDAVRAKLETIERLLPRS